MRIDPADLRKAFDKFVRAPAGKTWLETIGVSGVALLIISALQVFCGGLMLLTIVKIPSGLRWIFDGITLRHYRQSVRKRINESLDTVQILPACGIIIGPTGIALVLGSFSPIELKLLTSLATQFGEFYSDGSDDKRDSALLKLLRNDVYQENRRRRVPTHYGKGADLFLFDTQLELEDCHKIGDGIVLALAATPGESGVHVQLPWAPVQRVFLKGESTTEEGKSSEAAEQSGEYRGEMGERFVAERARLSIETRSWGELMNAVAEEDLNGLTKLFRALPQLRASPGLVTRLLSPALFHNSVPMMEFLVRQGANIHWFGASGPDDPEGPLYCAVVSDAADCVTWLLEHGASLKREVNEDGQSLPLAAAVQANNLKMVRLLVEHSANVNGGPGTLDLAVEAGFGKIAAYLESVGAKSADELGSTADRPNSGPVTFEEHLEQLGSVDATPIQEQIQGHPPIKIHVVTDEDGDKWLVTEGMSSKAMVVPPDGEEFQFAELSLHLRDNWPVDAESLQNPQYRWPITWLRKIARYPHQNQTWLGGRYSIIANGEPPAALGPKTKLTCLLIVANREEFGRWTREDGETVVFYDIIPLYTEERDFEQQHGFAALMRKFQSYGISPWLNPNRVNTCLLSEEEEAEIQADRDARNAEAEGAEAEDTYALARDEVDSELDDLTSEPAEDPWADDDDVLSPRSSGRKTKSRGSSLKSTSRSKSRGEETPLDDLRPSWGDFVQQACTALVVFGVATLIGFLFPASAIWMFVGFVLGAIGLLVRAWVMAFRHAWQHDRLAAALFIFPWYFVKYGIRNWPQTRACVVALGLFMVWITAPVIIGMPIGLIAQLLPKDPAMPNAAPVAKNPPKWEDIPKPAGIPEAKPRNRETSVVSTRRELRRDGMTATTVTWADGTIGSFVRPTLSRSIPSPVSYQQGSELHQKIRAAEIGAVIVGEVKGSELDFIYGGEDGVYSLNSSPGPAAVHAGLAKIDQSVKVKITVVPSQPYYPMLEQNGLISISNGKNLDQTAYKIELAQASDVSRDAPESNVRNTRPVRSGFRQPDAEDAASTLPPRPDFDAIRRSNELRTKITTLRNQVGSEIILDVIGSNWGSVYGGQDQIYTIDSDPCVAAVHAGFVKLGETASVKVTILPEQHGFRELKQNGITSHQWGGNYVCYRMELAKAEDQ